MPGGNINNEVSHRLGAVRRTVTALLAHATRHRSGGADPLTGTFSIDAVKLGVGERFYIKDSNDNNVASIDEDGNLRIKGSVYEGQESV